MCVPSRLLQVGQAMLSGARKNTLTRVAAGTARCLLFFFFLVPLRSALGHALCTMCVVEWATREEGVWSCPMCRGEDVGTWRSLPHHLGYS